MLKSPRSEAEWRDYYELRWRILRRPWQQPRGSERDAAENNAYHLMATDPDGQQILAVGRIHQLNAQQAQIRYMATSETSRGRGIGTQMLHALEQQARHWGVATVVLNAREQAVPFYQRNGYRIISAAEMLFGEIPHMRMEKQLRRPTAAAPGT